MIKPDYKSPELDSVQMMTFSVIAESPNEASGSIGPLTPDESDDNFFHF